MHLILMTEVKKENLLVVTVKIVEAREGGAHKKVTILHPQHMGAVPQMEVTGDVCIRVHLPSQKNIMTEKINRIHFFPFWHHFQS